MKTKLTEEDVRTLRQMHLEGKLNVIEAAIIYGVAAETIRRAVRRETWTHLAMGVPKTADEWKDAGEKSLKKFKAMNPRLFPVDEGEAALEKMQAALLQVKKKGEAGDKMVAELGEEDFMKGCGV